MFVVLPGVDSGPAQLGAPSSMATAEGTAGKSYTEALFSGIPPGVSDDHLINYLEIHVADCAVKDVQRGTKAGAVVVVFEEPVGQF